MQRILPSLSVERSEVKRGTNIISHINTYIHYLCEIRKTKVLLFLKELSLKKCVRQKKCLIRG